MHHFFSPHLCQPQGKCLGYLGQVEVCYEPFHTSTSPPATPWGHLMTKCPLVLSVSFYLSVSVCLSLSPLLLSLFLFLLFLLLSLLLLALSLLFFLLLFLPLLLSLPPLSFSSPFSHGLFLEFDTRIHCTLEHLGFTPVHWSRSNLLPHPWVWHQNKTEKLIKTNISLAYQW